MAITSADQFLGRKDKFGAAEAVWKGKKPPKVQPGVRKQLFKRLTDLDESNNTTVTRINGYKQVTGNVNNEIEIRVNNKYRLYFKWDSENQEPFDIWFGDHL